MIASLRAAAVLAAAAFPALLPAQQQAPAKPSAPVRSVPVTPGYPLQSMVAVFDFPEKGSHDDAEHVPELVVDHVRAWA